MHHSRTPPLSAPIDSTCCCFFFLLAHPIYPFFHQTTHFLSVLFFFFNDTATPEIYTLSPHDALPISARSSAATLAAWAAKEATVKAAGATLAELNQVQLRGRRIAFRGRNWYCNTPRRDHPHGQGHAEDRKSTRLNSSHLGISYAVFCL